MTSLEGIPRIGDIPEASLDADDVLSEADIRFSDDGTSLVSPSLVTALVSVISPLPTAGSNFGLIRIEGANCCLSPTTVG